MFGQGVVMVPAHGQSDSESVGRVTNRVEDAKTQDDFDFDFDCV